MNETILNIDGSTVKPPLGHRLFPRNARCDLVNQLIGDHDAPFVQTVGQLFDSGLPGVATNDGY